MDTNNLLKEFEALGSDDKSDVLVKMFGVLKMKEVFDFTSLMKKLYNISDVAPVAVQQVADSGAEGSASKEAEAGKKKLKLTAIGDNRIKVIKAVASALSVGLIDAKKVVDSCPSVLLEECDKDKAEENCKALKEVGATVDIE